MDETTGEVTRFRAELGQRIASVAAMFPTKTAAAEAAGVTPEQLNRWIGGTVKVPTEALWRLAKGQNVDFIWLASGERPRSAEITALHPGGRVIQEAALRDVLMALAEVTASEGLTFKSPDKYADLVLALHDYLIERRARDGAGADLTGMAQIIVLASR